MSKPFTANQNHKIKTTKPPIVKEKIARQRNSSQQNSLQENQRSTGDKFAVFEDREEIQYLRIVRWRFI